MALLFALMASSAGAFVRFVAPKASAQDPTWILGLGWRIVHSAQLWVLTQPRAAQLLPPALGNHRSDPNVCVNTDAVPECTSTRREQTPMSVHK